MDNFKRLEPKVSTINRSTYDYVVSKCPEIMALDHMFKTRLWIASNQGVNPEWLMEWAKPIIRRNVGFSRKDASDEVLRSYKAYNSTYYYLRMSIRFVKWNEWFNDNPRVCVWCESVPIAEMVGLELERSTIDWDIQAPIDYDYSGRIEHGNNGTSSKL